MLAEQQPPEQDSEPTDLCGLITSPPVAGPQAKLVLPATFGNLKLFEEGVVGLALGINGRIWGVIDMVHFAWLPWWVCEGAGHEERWLGSRAGVGDFDTLLQRAGHGENITNTAGDNEDRAKKRTGVVRVGLQTGPEGCVKMKASTEPLTGELKPRETRKLDAVAEVARTCLVPSSVVEQTEELRWHGQV